MRDASRHHHVRRAITVAGAIVGVLAGVPLSGQVNSKFDEFARKRRTAARA